MSTKEIVNEVTKSHIAYHHIDCGDSGDYEIPRNDDLSRAGWLQHSKNKSIYTNEKLIYYFIKHEGSGNGYSVYHVKSISDKPVHLITVSTVPEAVSAINYHNDTHFTLSSRK